MQGLRGVTERFSKLLTCNVNCPIIFRTYAVSHVVYIYNIIPTITGNGYMAPMELGFNIDIDLGLERTFGCNCYCIVPAATREKGFSDKSQPGIYLGHRENGSPGFIICEQSCYF